MLDVTDTGAVDRVFATVGALDHLVICAAGALAGPCADLDERDVRDFFEAKVWGQYRCL